MTPSTLPMWAAFIPSLGRKCLKLIVTLTRMALNLCDPCLLSLGCSYPYPHLSPHPRQRQPLGSQSGPAVCPWSSYLLSLSLRFPINAVKDLDREEGSCLLSPPVYWALTSCPPQSPLQLG